MIGSPSLLWLVSERALPDLRTEKSARSVRILSRRKFSLVPFGGPFSRIRPAMQDNFMYFSQNIYYKDFMAVLVVCCEPLLRFGFPC